MKLSNLAISIVTLEDRNNTIEINKIKTRKRIKTNIPRTHAFELLRTQYLSKEERQILLKSVKNSVIYFI